MTKVIHSIYCFRKVIIVMTWCCYYLQKSSTIAGGSLLYHLPILLDNNRSIEGHYPVSVTLETPCVWFNSVHFSSTKMCDRVKHEMLERIKSKYIWVNMLSNLWSDFFQKELNELPTLMTHILRSTYKLKVNSYSLTGWPEHATTSP